MNNYQLIYQSKSMAKLSKPPDSSEDMTVKLNFGKVNHSDNNL